MSVSQRDIAQLRAVLQEAVVKCSERCLYQSAKWTAELLVSIPEDDDSPEPEDSQMTEVPSNNAPAIVISGNPDPEEAALEAKEVNKYLLAKSFFDCREFDRCTAVFLPDTLLSGLVTSSSSSQNNQSLSTPKGKGKAKASATSSSSVLGVRIPKMSQKSLFLALYAKMISGEKQKDEDTEMVMGPHDGGKTINKELNTIVAFLQHYFRSRVNENGELEKSQGWLEYLYGMVLVKERNEEEALNWLIRSVKAYPHNWGAWLEITSLITRIEQLNQVMQLLPQTILCYMFYLHTSLELYQSTPQLQTQLQQLLDVFPTSPFLMTCLALLAYHMKDFNTAEEHFSSLLALHPHRLESLDHYSNILYVMSMRPKLSFLAHLCSSIDKFRPETCVVIGNYYSLISQHEKAVNYFRRALTLDRTCLSAWTLMGHEYVELKNTHAAIESYRRAVDVNRRDYRAWYGLGQTYEILEMHSYALWYFKRAAGLRPWDGKMWIAVGSCLQKMGRDVEGIKALKRALFADGFYEGGASGGFAKGGQARNRAMDPEILLQIATMYERMEQEDEAREYMELCIAQEEGVSGGVDAAGRRLSGGSDDEDGGGGGDNATGVTLATSKARMWLARYSMRHEHYDTAMRLATELCQDGMEVEEAKAIQREVRSRQDLEDRSDEL